MKHNFSFLPSLRRTTLLALLCLGIMPIWADNVITVAFKKKDGNRELYMQDKGSGLVEYDGSSSADASKWRKIPADETFTFLNKPYTVYYLQNVKTGKYLYAGDPHTNTGNSDWYYRVTKTGDKSTDDLYKWFIMPKDNGTGAIFNRDEDGISTEKSDGNYTYHLHSNNQHNNCTDTYAQKDKIPCGRSGDLTNGYSTPAIAESWVSTPACTIPNNTTIYVDVTNFTGAYSGNGYYLAIVGDQTNSSIDLCQTPGSYVPKNDQWVDMTQVEGNIYKAEITTNTKNSSLFYISNKKMDNYNDPNDVNVAGITAYDCTSGNNLYTIKTGYVSGQGKNISISTGTWSSYTPTDQCPNCGTVPANN